MLLDFRLPQVLFPTKLAEPACAVNLPKRYKVNGVLVPPGYSVLTRAAAQDLLQSGETEHLRVFQRRVFFLQDPHDRAYHDFLALCKADSKSLQKALVEHAHQTGTRIWFERRSRPESKSNWPVVHILIRPPYFKSLNEKSSENRLQPCGAASVAMLHRDQANLIHLVRTWHNKNHSLTAGSARRRLEEQLSANADKLSKHYGNWSKMAEIIIRLGLATK